MLLLIPRPFTALGFSVESRVLGLVLCVYVECREREEVGRTNTNDEAASSLVLAALSKAILALRVVCADGSIFVESTGQVSLGHCGKKFSKGLALWKVELL